jgi:hypothetical protein
VGYAVILNTASKANTTGGAFADTLTANTGDSLSIPNFVNGGARIFSMWGIDSDSVAELALTLTRYESVHDSQRGVRIQIPALTPGGAATVAAHNLLGPDFSIPVFSGDSITMTVTSTAADDLAVSWLTEYDDLPGVKASFVDFSTVEALRVTQIGLYQDITCSATPGSYGATRALNTDDTRLSADKYYAILGCSVRTQITTIALTSTTWGGQTIGLPMGVWELDTLYWFAQLSKEKNRPLIPVINANDAGNVLVKGVDGEASTHPYIDWNMVELSRNPLVGA